MANVSGALLYDNNRTNSATGLPGIGNVPMVLQDTVSGLRLAVLTATDGSFEFTNVPSGDYNLVEAYGDSGTISTTGNFTLEATVGVAPVAVTPPISWAPSPPSGATNLDCVTRNTMAVTVATANITNLHILNGPVQYTPIVIDATVAVEWDNNLISAADAGSFGSFPPGTLGMTGADPNPYPGVNPGFTYVLPAAATANPSDGYYTIQNIANNISYQISGAWWRIADRTQGNETGRMMIVNGDNPGSIFFTDDVAVTPNTDYLFATNILNMIKVSGRVSPQLGVIVTAPDGTVLYDKDLGQTIPVSFDQPQWFESGTIINSGEYTSLSVQFYSDGPSASGNDYAIDDVGFYPVDITLPPLAKTTSQSTALLGDTLTFTVSYTNNTSATMTNTTFTDPMPLGLSFVPGSVTINGSSSPTSDPTLGFALPDTAPGDTTTIAFEALAASAPPTGVATNTAALAYEVYLIGESPTLCQLQSNPVDVAIAPVTPRDQAKTDIIQSVALQEAALAHIINAEGEKMQKIIALEGVTFSELMTLNKSVTQLLSTIARLEMILAGKLEMVV